MSTLLNPRPWFLVLIAGRVWLVLNPALAQTVDGLDRRETVM